MKHACQGGVQKSVITIQIVTSVHLLHDNPSKALCKGECVQIIQQQGLTGLSVNELNTQTRKQAADVQS